jgi:hydrogenase maturation protease
MMHPPVRVVGVGSPHGDDAAGWQVVRALRENHSEMPGVSFAEVDSGHRLLDLLDGRGTLILVDALMDGSPCGTVHRLAWPDDRIECVPHGSTHFLGVSAALKLAQNLGLLPPCVVIIGISAASIEPHGGMSQPMISAVECAVQIIRGELLAMGIEVALQALPQSIETKSS